jgi:transposase InsO family protein
MMSETSDHDGGYGLIRSRRRGKAKFDGRDRQLTIAEGPNDLWAADYKGQIFTRKDRYVFPLTVTDLFSRYLLRCHALRTTAHEPAKKQFERLFAEYGLPRMIRTDNGSPFATPAPCGLSRLSIWWLKLGILHERIDPGRPQQNGSHERMHRTLKAETAKPPGPSLVAQQKRFDAFAEVFNNERPHEAIGMKTPSCLYANSARAMPRGTPAFEYDSGIEIRRVHQSGRIRFKNGSLILLGRALAGEDVALKEAEDGIWHVYLGPLLLGALDEHCFDVGLIRLTPPVRRNKRRRWR